MLIVVILGKTERPKEQLALCPGQLVAFGVNLLVHFFEQARYGGKEVRPDGL